MELQTLTVQGFRNLSDTNLNFSRHFNFFIGNNGAGKTNLLEAVYVAGTASSFRARENKVLINHAAPSFRVEACADTGTASIFFDGTRKKLMLRNNEVKKLSDYVGWLGITMLSIEDLWIVRGAPAQRRSFFDWVIAKAAPRYLDDLIECRKLVSQRNRVLQSLHDNGTMKVLEAYNDQYVSVSNRIYQERRRFLPILKTSIIDAGAHLGLHNFSIDYQSTCADMEMNHEQLIRVYDREMQYGRTVIGPHRDDLILYVDGHHLQHYASEGQERAAAISLKLAEASIIKDQTGKRPLLLLDEASSELDEIKRKLMFDLLDGQILYASTQLPSHLPVENKDCAYFSVQGGTIEATTPH